MQQSSAKDIDSYISCFASEIAEKLTKVRETIKQAAPDAEEAISYQIPTFKLKGNLVHFAAFKNHIGFYPGSSGVANFKDELAAYEVSKGTIRFPLDKEMPLGLISKVVKFRVIENVQRAAKKA